MWKNTLGLALRSGNLKTGDGVIDSVRAKNAKLVIIANDASDRTKKTITDKCKFYETEFIITSTADELSTAIGKTNRVAVSILDEGFAKKIKEKMEV